MTIGIIISICIIAVMIAVLIIDTKLYETRIFKSPLKLTDKQLKDINSAKSEMIKWNLSEYAKPPLLEGGIYRIQPKEPNHTCKSCGANEYEYINGIWKCSYCGNKDESENTVTGTKYNYENGDMYSLTTADRFSFIIKESL